MTETEIRERIAAAIDADRQHVVSIAHAALREAMGCYGEFDIERFDDHPVIDVILDMARIIRRLGDKFEARHRPRRNEDRNLKIWHAYYTEGKSAKEVGKQFHLSERSVLKLISKLKETNVDLPDVPDKRTQRGNVPKS